MRGLRGGKASRGVYTTGPGRPACLLCGPAWSGEARGHLYYSTSRSALTYNGERARASERREASISLLFVVTDVEQPCLAVLLLGQRDACMMLLASFSTSLTAINSVAPPPLHASPLARLIDLRYQLQQSNPSSVDVAAAVVGACLDVCKTFPGPKGYAAIPEDVPTLAQAAAFFDWTSSGAAVKQHVFNIDMWDDAIEALAWAAVTIENGSHRNEDICEVADAVAASANFLTLPPAQQWEVIDALAEAVSSRSFLEIRKEALAASRQRRGSVRGGAGGEPKPSAADAYAAAKHRRRKKDFVAVPPSIADDEAVIEALYDSAVHHLGPQLLAPLGFPFSALGLRSLVGATRAVGSQRACAALGTIWHAADEPAPIIVRRGLSSFDSANADEVRAAAAGATTLVLAFSSLGWNGVVRAEWGATLRAAGDDRIVVAHCLDTAQSWFTTNPISGEYDDGAWWDGQLAELCAGYQRVCILGESMGATGALRFARHATSSVVALVPQIDVRDFVDYAEARADFDDARKARLRDAIVQSCLESRAELVLHVGQDPPDLRQPEYLAGVNSAPWARLRVVQHAVPGHALGAGLKAQGVLKRTVLSDLLGHSYLLPPARS